MLHTAVDDESGACRILIFDLMHCLQVALSQLIPSWLTHSVEYGVFTFWGNHRGFLFPLHVTKDSAIADQDALLETVGLHSKYIQKKCAHVKHHGLLHTMLQAAARAAQSVTSARCAPLQC